MPPKKIIDQSKVKTIFINKNDLDHLSLYQLKEIAKNRPDLFRNYTTYRTKKSLLTFMKAHIKGKRFKIKKPKTIIVKIQPNVIRSFKAIATDDKEHSIGIDFQRKGKVPERFFVMEGGRIETVKFNLFDMFGHTHPMDKHPTPSASDIMNMQPFVPEFLISGISKEMIILNVEDLQRYGKWSNQNLHKGINDEVFDLDEVSVLLTKSLRDKNGSIKGKYYKYLLNDQYGREVFFKVTGVRVYPYRRGMLIEIKDQPKYNKKVPTISKSDLKVYHRQ